MTLELLVNQNYKKNNYPKLGSSKINYPISYMSVILGQNNNVTTIHDHGEYYTPEQRDAVKNLPEPYGTIADNNRRVGEHVDSVYSDWINTREGKEFINFLRREGNGSKNPGYIDEIFVVNGPDGVVAATMPEYVKSNIIINADYYMKYCDAIASAIGKSPDYVLARHIIPHELGHQFLQTRNDRNKPEPEVEFHNDMQMIRFYIELANKYSGEPKAKDYINDAKVFTVRYNGLEKQLMDNYISQNTPKEILEENTLIETDDSDYRRAA